MEQTADGTLIALARTGHADAFAQVVERYKDSLTNYLTHLTGSRDEAEDFAQESFVRLYQAMSRYDERGRLAPYLYRIATNLVASDRRRARRWRVLSLALPSHEESPAPLPDRELLRDEVQKRVSRAIAELPLAHRSALVLRDIEGWSYHEIAKALGCREGTVKSRINRARAQLRRQLSDYWNGERS